MVLIEFIGFPSSLGIFLEDPPDLEEPCHIGIDLDHSVVLVGWAGKETK
jgi:hypothetical protein